MVLDDVPDGSGLLVERGAALDPEGLGDRDLDVVDELPVPDRLEDAVREAKDQHVLDRLLAQVVVDPEDLALLEVLEDRGVQLLRALEVVAERLLDDEPCPARRMPALAELGDDGLNRRRRDGEVVDAVPGRSVLLVELVQARDHQVLTLVVGEVRGDIARDLCQLIPDVLPELVPAVLLHGLLHARAKVVRRHRAPCDADDREVLGEEPPECERVERGKELPLRQVAGGSEDRERARLGCPAAAKPFEQRVLGVLGDLGHVSEGRGSVWLARRP